MRITRTSQVETAARKIIRFKEQYKKLSKKLGGVPWALIGAIHMRESNQNFARHMHNGDSLQRRTYRVPKGRIPGIKPPYTFVQSALDAFKLKGWQRVPEWTIEQIAYEAERYNGWGYAWKKKPSPYLWAGSQHYRKGKYVADHKYSSTTIDRQLGVMPVMRRVEEIDGEKVVPSSRRWAFLSATDNVIKASGVGTIISWNTIDRVQQFLSENQLLIVLASGFAGWMVIRYIKALTLREYKEGRYTPSGVEDDADPKMDKLAIDSPKAE